MSWYDELLNSAQGGGNALLDAGKFIGEAALAYKVPAMYNGMMEARNRARNQNEREAFMNKYIGQSEVPFSQTSMDMPNGQRSIIQEPQQGSGQLGGQWTPMQSALEMMKAPTPINRTSGGGAFRSLLTSRDTQKRAPIFKVMGVPDQPDMRTNALYNQDTGTFEPKGQSWKQGSQNEINIGTPKQYIKAGTQLVNSRGQKVRVPVGMTHEQAANQGLSYGDKQTSESIKSEAATGVSLDMLDELETLHSKGGNITGLPGFLTDLRSGNDVWGVAANLFMNKAGIPLSEKQARSTSLAKSISNQLIQAMRGAAVGPEEQKAFEKQLPVSGQPDKLFMSNLNLTRKNLLAITKKKKDLERGVTDKNQKVIMWDDM